MIVLPEQDLTPIERHGLDVLVDLSRLLPAPASTGAVHLAVVDGGDEGLQAIDETPVVVDGRLTLPRAQIGRASCRERV